METPTHTRPEEIADTALAIVLDGVSEKWQMNVLQIRGCPTRVSVTLDGYGTVEAPAIRLRPAQARRLATQIIEILGPEIRKNPRMNPDAATESESAVSGGFTR
jgi:hypothetical protein